MAKPTRIGNENPQTTASPASFNLNIPSDCTLLCFHWHYYFGSNSTVTGITVDGVSMTIEAQHAGVGSAPYDNCCGVATLKNPTTGSSVAVVVTYSNSGARSEGPSFLVDYIKGEASTGYVIDSDASFATGGTLELILTGTDADSLITASCQSYTGTSPVLDGASNLYNDVAYNNEVMDATDVTGTATSTTIGMSGVDYSSIVAIAIAGASGDTTAPTLGGSVSVSAVSTSQLNVTYPSASDDTAVTSYILEVSADGSTGWSTLSGSLSTSGGTYNDTGLSASQTRYYRVTASDAAANSVTSSVASGTTDAATSVATISAVTSSNGSDTATALGTLTITVDDSTGVTAVTVNGVSCTSVATPTGTSVTCTCPKAFGDNYGVSADVVVTNATGDSTGYAVTTYIPTGYTETDFTVAYASLSTDSPFYGDSGYAALVAGDSCVYESVTTPDSHSVTMAGDGDFTLGGTLTAQQTFDFYIFDDSDNTTGTDGTITIDPVFYRSLTISSASTLSLTSKIKQYGQLASTSSTTLSFNGQLIDYSALNTSSTSSLSLTGSLKLYSSFASSSASSLSLTGSLNNNFSGSFSSVSNSGLSLSSTLKSYSSFNSSSTSTLSASAKIVQYGALSCSTISSLSLVGSLNGSFAGTFNSVSASGLSLTSKLINYNSFSSTASSAISFSGSSAQSSAFSSSSTTSISFNGKLVYYGSLSSLSSSALALTGTLLGNQTGSFNSTTSSTLGINYKQVLYSAFSSVSESTLGFTRSEIQAIAKRTIVVQSNNRTITAQSNNRTIRVN